MKTWGDAPAEPADEIIAAGEFFPAVSTAKFRQEYRIPAEIPPDLVRDFLTLAVIRVRAKLAPWRGRMTAAGCATLADVPQEGGEKLELWRRAVSCEAKAQLLRETVTVDRKPAAENAAKSAPETEQTYSLAATRAIRLISGRGTGTAEVV